MTDWLCGCIDCVSPQTSGFESQWKSDGEVRPIAGVEMQSLGGGMYVNSDTVRLASRSILRERIADIPRFVSSDGTFQFYVCLMLK
jgi:hypothetical protein